MVQWLFQRGCECDSNEFLVQFNGCSVKLVGSRFRRGLMEVNRFHVISATKPRTIKTLDFTNV